MREFCSAILMALAFTLPAQAQDPCVEKDPHVNHDAEATKAGRIAVKDFLRATFKVE